MNLGVLFLIILVAGAAGALLVLTLQRKDKRMRVQGQDIGKVLAEHEEQRENIEAAVHEAVESLSDKELADEFKELYDAWKARKSG